MNDLVRNFIVPACKIQVRRPLSRYVKIGSVDWEVPKKKRAGSSAVDSSGEAGSSGKTAHEFVGFSLFIVRFTFHYYLATPSYSQTMASSLSVSMFSLIFFFPLSLALPAVPALILPILKNNKAHQYYTTIQMGLPINYVRAVIDLVGQLRMVQLRWLHLPTRPGCTNDTCGVFGYNPFENVLASQGLGEDGITVSSTDGKSFMSSFQAPGFQFICSDSSLSQGLASGIKGMAGVMFLGGGSYYIFDHPTENAEDYSESLISTPLIINPASALKKIKRVTSVAPFGACFSSRTIASSQMGPPVPVIDLVLQDKTSRWRIYGANSMVKVKKDVLCLGFVDRGSERLTSIVLGGYQLENYLVEFD
ncbi:hypothetical protein RJ639_022044 [Escallonia herrerae]|uniref:Xylanase inhibitor C-terminal domain-containing protein n=1 Tax=Escallonia herrerae TaxID=1293975 RepID=A0AA88V5L9_9ASTE|nr:hypothetical protein RJ639_022044 [Escallonia herrerae]